MSLDAYQPCPCGSGKKIKFCGCKDLLPDLDKVSQMLDGEQRHAALAELDRLLTKQPDQPALLAMKSSVQMNLEDIEGAGETTEHFLKVAPNNAVALAQSAMIKAANGEGHAAVAMLQRSLEEIEQQIALPVYEAVGVIGQVLLAEGKYLAARGHLLLQAAFSGGKDERAMNMVMQLNSAREVPLPLKLDLRYEPCPADAAWRGEFTAAMKCAERGAWQLAFDQLQSLAEKAQNQPPILKNLALISSWLGDSEKTVKAWRRYAAIDGLLEDETIEAETIAQLIDPDTHKDRVDEMEVAFRVNNAEMASEILISERTVDRMPMDPKQFRNEDEPPPKAIFWLLDKELPTTGEGIQREDIPSILGSLFLFGKQTDREARLELTCTKNDAYNSTKQRVTELLGEYGGEIEKETKVSDASAVAKALSWNWRLPDDTPPETRQQLLAEYRREVTYDQWPQTPLPVLDGKTPTEVAGDPTYAVRLAAAVNLLQMNGEETGWQVDYDELRKQLQLPIPQPISAAGEDELQQVSNLQLVRVETSQLSDIDLGALFRRAVFLRADSAIKRFGQAILERESFDGGLSRSDVYMALTRAAADPDEVLEWIEAGRQASVADSLSPAQWYIMELPIRLQRGEVERFQQIMDTLRANHFNEPGVAEQVFELLMRLGIIGPDGQPAQGPPTPADGEASATPQEGGGIWTPESDAAPKGGQESKLWVPGMD